MVRKYLEIKDYTDARTSTAERNRIFQEYNLNKQKIAIDNLDQAKVLYKNIQPIVDKGLKVTHAELKDFYDESENATKRLKNLDVLWNDKENKIKFKVFNTKEEFETAVNNIKDADTQAVMKHFYAEKEIGGIKKYAKIDFMGYAEIQAEAFDKANGHRTISLRGISDIPNFNATPYNINKHFSLTEQGTNEMEDMDNKKFSSSKSRSEIISIKDTVQKYKKEQNRLTNEERRASLLKLKRMGEATEGEVEKEIADNLKVPSKVIPVETSWIPTDKAQILGKDAVQTLSGYRERNRTDNIAGAIDNTSDEITNPYKIAMEKLSKDTEGFVDPKVKSQIADLTKTHEANLYSLDILDDYYSKISSGDEALIFNARGSIKEGLPNKYLASTPQIRRAINKLKLPLNIDDIGNAELLNVLDESMNGLTKNINGIDAQLLNVLQSNLDYTSMSDSALLLTESKSKNNEEFNHLSKTYNQGTMNREGLTEEEISRTIFDDRNIDREKIANDIETTLRQQTSIEEHKDSIISIVQQKETAFGAAASKRNTLAIKVKPLNRPLTITELIDGSVVKDKSTTVPIQHFAEFEELMSIRNLGRNEVLPFTDVEWARGTVIFGKHIETTDNLYDLYNKGNKTAARVGEYTEIPLNHFYEYYNKENRIAQRDSILTKNKDMMLEINESKISELTRAA